MTNKDVYCAMLTQNRSKALVMASVNRSSPITKYHIGKCSASLCLGLSLSTQYWWVQSKKSMDGASEQMQSIGNDSEQVISKHHVSRAVLTGLLFFHLLKINYFCICLKLKSKTFFKRKMHRRLDIRMQLLSVMS